MNPLIDSYIQYISAIRRYSPRTQSIYRDVLVEYAGYSLESPDDPEALAASLVPSSLRNYEVHLMEDRKLGARTVNLHLSVLSGFCRYLMTQGRLKSNPVRLVTRPKTEKRLPEFYRDEAMEKYFSETAHAASEDELELLRTLDPGEELARTLYERRLRRLVVSLLHASGLRRAELASLDVRSLDRQRNMLTVRGKGDKMREVPLIPSVVGEIDLYLQAAEVFFGGVPEAGDPLLRTPAGRRLYPVYIDRAVKAELGALPDITGRKSPHVLRHTLATGLLNEGSDLNSIKELLGHSSLAATQVYTHNSIERLKAVYEKAHPRAKDPSDIKPEK
ncbi:MAG: tyrosine-type recombinase/integrase [Bacteroidales bacterium]|nr:tyrosine-type recombinase/integrase [Bacteroidales bacterium]